MVIVHRGHRIKNRPQIRRVLFLDGRNGATGRRSHDVYDRPVVCNDEDDEWNIYCLGGKCRLIDNEDKIKRSNAYCDEVSKVNDGKKSAIIRTVHGPHRAESIRQSN